VLAEGLDGTTKQIQDIHTAVADRSLKLAGPAERPARALHDRIADRIYRSLRTVGPAAIRSGALTIGLAVDADAERMHGSGRGRALVSAFNGVFGDALARRHNGLALRMSIWASGREVHPTQKELAAAFPNATGKVVVFIHGFGETDNSWRWFAESSWGDPSLSYGELLRRQRGFTPLYLHYNTGRTIAENAAELSRLLEAVDQNWPVPLEQTVLIGHSAGGRVARAAVRHGNLSGARWMRTATHVFTLGTPIAAISAEHVVKRSASALAKLPETRPVAQLLNTRSAGLKDLSENNTGPLPGWVEDVRLPKPQTRTRVGHFKLLNHPAIYAQIAASLSAHSAPDRAQAAQGARSARGARGLRAPRRSPRR
jgi:pimeloyl-ACP methyl ester carboxylesterase